MSRIRINVSFGETKVLVGCGEGNLTVDELVSQAIVKFKKRMKMVSMFTDGLDIIGSNRMVSARRLGKVNSPV